MPHLASPDPARINADRRPGRRVPDGRSSGWAVIAAASTPTVLIGGWLAGDALQPTGYSPMQQTMSVLAGQQGTDSWLMTGTLGLVGFALVATGVSLTAVRWPGRLLLVVAGSASIGVAACPEPASGPTDLHLAFAVICVVATAVWPAAAAQPGPQAPWVLSYQAGACVTAVFAALSVWLLLATQSGIDLGLAERLTSSAQGIWPLVVATSLWLADRQPADQPEPDEAARRAVVSARCRGQ